MGEGDRLFVMADRHFYPANELYTNDIQTPLLSHCSAPPPTCSTWPTVQSYSELHLLLGFVSDLELSMHSTEEIQGEVCTFRDVMVTVPLG